MLTFGMMLGPISEAYDVVELSLLKETGTSGDFDFPVPDVAYIGGPE